MTGRQLSFGSRRGALVCGVLAVLLAGCGVSRERFVPPEELPFSALDATREELLGQLESESGRLSTIRAVVNYFASGNLRDDDGTVTEKAYDPVRGGLIVEWPSMIRMNANTGFGLVQAFDMTSDGTEFRLSVPAQGRFYHGPNNGTIEGASENPLLQLRPHHVVEALTVDIRKYLEDPSVVRSFVEVAEGRRLFYVFSFIDIEGTRGNLREKIWIDRLNLEVGRKQVFQSDGALELQVDYDDYLDVGEGVSVPHRVTINRPIEGAALDIEILEVVSLNTELDPAMFVLRYPSGAESIRVGEPIAVQDGTRIDASGSGSAVN